MLHQPFGGEKHWEWRELSLSTTFLKGNPYVIDSYLALPPSLCERSAHRRQRFVGCARWGDQNPLRPRVLSHCIQHWQPWQGWSGEVGEYVPSCRNHGKTGMLKSSQQHAGPGQKKGGVWGPPTRNGQPAGAVEVLRRICKLLVPHTNSTSELLGLTAAGKWVLFRAAVLSSRSAGLKLERFIAFGLHSWPGLTLNVTIFLWAQAVPLLLPVHCPCMLMLLLLTSTAPPALLSWFCLEWSWLSYLQLV